MAAAAVLFCVPASWAYGQHSSGSAARPQTFRPQSSFPRNQAQPGAQPQGRPRANAPRGGLSGYPVPRPGYPAPRPGYPGPPYIVGVILAHGRRTEAARLQFEASLKLAEAAGPEFEPMWEKAARDQLALLP